MTAIERVVCDGCGKREETGDPLTLTGWVIVKGDLVVTTGTKNEKTGVYETIWINARLREHHFCCFDCIKNHNDNKVVPHPE